MSLSRSPSPDADGGWSSPGLMAPKSLSRRSSATPSQSANGAVGHVTWASAQTRSADVKQFPSFTGRKQSFVGRTLEKLKSSLPHGASSRNFAQKEKLGRGRWQTRKGSAWSNVQTMAGKILWKMRLRFALAFCLLLVLAAYNLLRALACSRSRSLA